MDVAGEEAVASTNIYLLNDLVRLEPNSKGGGLGTVCRSYPSLPAGTFKIVRVDGRLQTAKASDITDIADRSYFCLGGTVVSASEPFGRIGVVTGVTTVLDLVKLGGAKPTEIVMSGVSPDRLRRVRELNLGDFVVSGPWLGRVVEVSLHLDVSFGDGAVCKFTRGKDFKKLRPVAYLGYYMSPQMNTAFYPGQRVTGCRSSSAAVFKDCRWLRGHWKPSRKVGTVAKVEMAGVLVNWVASALHGTNQQLVQASAPPAYQDPSNLTFFSSDIDCTWGLSDRCFLRNTEKQDESPSSSSTATTTAGDDHARPPVPAVDTTARTKKEQEEKLNRKTLSQKLFFHDWRRRTRREDGGRHVEIEQPMSVANTHSTVNLVWQDGTRQSGVPSTSLIPYMVTSAHEFFPGHHVVDMAGATTAAAHHAAAAVEDGDATRSTGRSGIVKSLDCKDRTVRVSWFKAESSPDEAREVEGDGTMSAYDLALASQGEYYAVNNVVVRRRLPSRRSDGASTAVQVQPPAQGSKDRAAAGADLSWVGHVVARPDGHVQVNWGDGSTSKVLPHEISVVIEPNFRQLQAEMGDWVEDDGVDERQDQEDSAAAIDNTDNDTQNPAEDSDVEGDNDSADEDGKDSVDEDGNDSAVDEDGIAATRASRLGDIFRLVIRLAGQVLAQGMRYLPNGLSSSSSSSESPETTESVGVMTAPVSDDHGDTDDGDAIAIEAGEAAVTSNDAGVNDDESAEKGKENQDAVGDEDQFRFPHFDVVQSPTDHHYRDIVGQGGNGGKRWVKAVQKEWKILDNDLPDTIYVRAFEDRMDLLRAVMVGASGTPYHDALFFFDLHLPPSYPAAPPLVYYHSFGLRLNPNLYNSGTVCLSLLNTFGGEGTEVWSPATSTLLQVVVSIQGLILNDQPYYNEAGYEALVGRPEACRNVLPYSENAYLLTLKTVLHLLRRPPQGFEGFVRDHFRRRGRFMLRACEAYLRGCAVGTLDDDACCATDRSKERPCPAGLRLALANVVPRLVAAFTEIGAEGCDQFHELQDLLVGGDGPPAAH